MGAGGRVGSIDERKLEFTAGRFHWSDGTGVTVKITREGIEVGCKTVSWAAWDELKRLAKDM